MLQYDLAQKERIVRTQHDRIADLEKLVRSDHTGLRQLDEFIGGKADVSTQLAGEYEGLHSGFAEL
jgi:hypothetical protein